ncbi:MAG: MBL fold metallo-hydrolase [Acidobacteriota bacterium]|nr:MBL fold metallo-hydrolase [Acidobacteriota bacterium]
MSDAPPAGEPRLIQIQAGPMANFVYVLADPSTSRAWVVDPAWEPIRAVEIAQEQGYDVVGVLATHFHQDHIGGDIFGQHVPGVRELRAEFDVPMLIHEAEAERGAEMAGCPPHRVESFRDGDVLELGDLAVEVLHTPGHSPGSCCFRAGSHVLTADTLFVQGIGRIDLPHSDADAMYRSLQRLKNLPPGFAIYPGHDYGPESSSTIGRELMWNAYLRPDSLEQWRAMLGFL